MKPKTTLRHFLCIASSAVLAISHSHAATLTWDAGGAGGAITNGGGAWLGAGLWNNAGAAATWTSGDDAIFAGPATNGGNVTLASPTTVNSLTFSPSFNSIYTLGTSGQAITLSTGITKNAGSAAVTIISPITLGGVQTWTNNSTGLLKTSADANKITNGGFQLTFDGTGNFEIGTPNVITTTSLAGSGALVKNGTGVLTMGGNNSAIFSGNVTVGGGVLNYGDTPTSLGTGNVLINGGVLESRWSTGLTRTQGMGAGEIQITGGVSGLSGAGANATFNIGNITWGSATFTPTQFVLQSSNAGTTGSGTLSNTIDLGGLNRTIRSDQAGGLVTGGTGTFSGAISNGSITKEGNGTHVFTGVNTYAGGTTINGGVLRFDKITAMPNSGAVTVNTGAILGIDLGAAGDWTGGTSGVGTLGGLLGGVGGAGTSTVVYSGNVGLNLNLTADTTYSGNIADVGTTLAIHKTGTNKLTLSGTNNYTGATNIIAGQLTLDGSLSGTAISTVGSAVLVQSSTGAISGAASYTQSSTGTSSLAGNNSYTGGTTLSAGTLTVGHANALGTGTGTIALNGGTIQSSDATARTFTNAVTIGGNFTVGGTGNLTFSNTGAVALGGNRSIAVTTSGVVATFAQAFSGANSITKTGAGTLVLSGTNTNNVTGSNPTIVNNGGGVVIFKGANALPPGVLQVPSGTGTFRIQRDVAYSASGSNGFQVFANGTTGNFIFERETSGPAVDYAFSNGASGSFDISGGATANFSAGANIASGTPTLTFSSGIRSQGGDSNGAAVINASGVNLNITTLTATNNGSNFWTLGGTSTGNVVTGAISHSVIKQGIGTWKISGANAYAGNTTVSNGTLLLGANNVLPNTTNVVIGTATLDADTRTDTAGTLDATGAATINLGTGAALAFANSSGVTAGVWAGALNITGTFVPGNGVDPGPGPVSANPGSIRFGVNASGLTASQLADITVNGSGTYALDAFGYLIVGGGATAYDTWKSTNAPSGNPSDDFDGDGVSNIVEFMLNGLAATNDLDKLPVVSQVGGNLELSFTCLKVANRGGALLKLQYSKDLGITDLWSGHEVTVPDTAGVVGSVTFSIPSANANPNLVNLKASIPASEALPGTKLFGRLMAQP